MPFSMEVRDISYGLTDRMKELTYLQVFFTSETEFEVGCVWIWAATLSIYFYHQ